MDSQTTLWYRSPATDFDHALPVGNGRIGGMLFGDPEHEVIKLNEDSGQAEEENATTQMPMKDFWKSANSSQKNTFKQQKPLPLKKCRA